MSEYKLKKAYTMVDTKGSDVLYIEFYKGAKDWVVAEIPLPKGSGMDVISEVFENAMDLLFEKSIEIDLQNEGKGMVAS